MSERVGRDRVVWRFDPLILTDKLAVKDLLEKMFAGQDPDWDKKPDIKWNFTKFIIDREGNVVARFEPTIDMKEVEKAVAALI